MEAKIRRYDLDWLRVFVFALLIIYHVGMFFVPWEWHIKNNEIYPSLRWPMLFVNQWRLSILFVISGMGTRYALAYRSGGEFVKERVLRLGLPLIFGMLIIVPPQVYVERIAHGQFSGGYFDFFPLHAFEGIYPEGNLSWHHLWFLIYLLTYSLILTPLFLHWRNKEDSRLILWIKSILKRKFGIFLFIIPLFFTEAFLEPFFPVTHAFIDDWFTLFNFIILFAYGYLLISARDEFWKAVASIKNIAFGIGIASFVALLYARTLEDTIFVHYLEALIKVVNTWSWILVLFGFAARYLNRPSRLLTYCNTAVYPFYILHQTITVLLAYMVMNKDWGFAPKFGLLTIGTFFISWVLYEYIIRRIGLLRPLFGLKG